MKKKIIEILVISIALILCQSCEKDTTENTIKPPVVNYPYDSIHKKLIGNWVIRKSNGIGDFDTSFYYKITYDSFIYKYHPLSCSWCDSNYHTRFKTYKYFSDSVEGKFPGLDSFGNIGFFYWKTKIDIYTKDSIKIYKLHENNFGERFDVTLTR